MTTAVQRRRGTTGQHTVFTGLEGEVTIDTTKDTAVIHDGALAGGHPLAREDLVNTTVSALGVLTGSGTADNDQFLVFDTSAGALKKISRAELNNAIEQDPLANVVIVSGTINGVQIGNTTAATILNVDNLRLDGNVITSTDSNGNIAITPNGTGEVDISKVDIDSGTIDATVIGGATRAAGSFTTLNANGNTTLGDASADTVTINGTVQPGVVISGSSTGDALRITQTGTGNALVVAGDTILSNVNVIGASYDSVSFSVAAEEVTPTDLFFSPDGLKMYVIGSTGDDVNEYNLSTAWVVSSAVFVTNFSVASQDATPQGLYFRADGTKMYVVGATNDVVFQYTLSTPWSVATATYENISFSVAGQETTPTAIYFRPNGLSMYVVGNATDAVYQYTLSTAWNVSTATLLQSFSISGQEVTSTGMSFTGDGSRMFITGSTGDDVNVYNLTTPWDISTSAFVGVFSVSGQDTSPGGIYIKPDGTKMYIVGSTTDAVYQYTVPSIDIQLTGPTSVASLEVQQDLVVYGNTAGSFLNNGFRENIGGQYYNLVSQTDIGTAPNEIPLNQYLGSMAYLDADNISFDARGTNTAAQNLAINKLTTVVISADTTLTTTVPLIGSTAFVIVITSGATSRTVTFGTGFKSTGTLATGTDADRRFVFQFISDGTNLVEVSRTAAITY